MAFTEELTLYMFVWATMLGVSLAFKHGANMDVSLLYDRFPQTVRKDVYKRQVKKPYCKVVWTFG